MKKRVVWWAALAAVAACGGKLQVDSESPNAVGVGATSGAADYAGSGVAGGGLGGYAGAAGTAGGLLSANNPNGRFVLAELNEKCTPASLNKEAAGTPAEALIATPERCDDGLTCEKGLCVPAPACPQPSGVCLLRHVDLGSVGGSRPQGFGGSLGNSPSSPLSGVCGMAANDSNLYWVEYGTRDDGGTYLNDGALMAYSLDKGVISKVAGGLAGPTTVGLTDDFAYVFLDGALPLGALIHAQILRIPLSGGEPQVVQEGVPLSYFTASADQAFWSNNGVVYGVSGAAGSPQLLLTRTSYEMHADATHLYLDDPNSGMWRVPLGSTTVEPFGAAQYLFSLVGDAVYAVEPMFDPSTMARGIVLDETTKTSAVWQRVQPLGEGMLPSRFQTFGDRYFVDTTDIGNVGLRVVTGVFGSADPPTRVVERNRTGDIVNELWQGSKNGVFWSNGSEIYARAIPGK
jgi:hypothetical protein